MVPGGGSGTRGGRPAVGAQPRADTAQAFLELQRLLLSVPPHPELSELDMLLPATTSMATSPAACKTTPRCPQSLGWVPCAETATCAQSRNGPCDQDYTSVLQVITPGGSSSAQCNQQWFQCSPGAWGTEEALK
ncbi:transcription factor 24-like [Choloepus didactylus]|uniref:transcription factor 24-like n=1 Tax=Choloepus didactylus TaxID=27675 RepID=UPI0018A037AC|nr:transcription factor 24-like [Choloepus didactylus]XP_037680440.1 transcription factor 24-like [Choloepus didactylus]